MTINLHKYVESCVIYSCERENNPQNFVLQCYGSLIFESNHFSLLNPNLSPFSLLPSIRLTCDVPHVNLNGFIDKNVLDYWWTLLFAVGDFLLPCRCLWGNSTVWCERGVSGSTVFIKMDHITKNQPLPYSSGYWFFSISATLSLSQQSVPAAVSMIFRFLIGADEMSQ